jgi:hypothetical protein
VILRANLYEEGLTLAGPPAASLVKPVSPAELRQATLANIPGWLLPLLQEPERMFYTLKTGELCPKQAAARWAEETLDVKWAGLIRRAWAGRETPQSPIPPGDLQETLDFIQYLMDYANNEENADETKNETLQG